MIAILFVLNINGNINLKECSDKKEARSEVKILLKEAKKYFPNKRFRAKYYYVIKKE